MPKWQEGNMSLNDDLVQEIEFLSLYDLDSIQQGLKIHHEADTQRIAAARRLFNKGMITQVDGGYLTDRGLETAELAQVLLRLLQDTES
jgi:uncharacterized protein (TIGR02647 family)